MLAQYPLSFGQWLQALNYTLSKPREIAIVSDPKAADTEALQNVVREGYRLFQAVALGAPCRDFACQAPIRNPGELRAQLGPQ